MNKCPYILWLICALVMSVGAHAVELPVERPFIYPLPDRALITIKYLDAKASHREQTSTGDVRQEPPLRVKEQQITKFREITVSRVELSDGTKYETWRLNGQIYAPVANENRHIPVSQGAQGEDPFFPDPYWAISWVGEETFFKTEKTAEGNVWVFKSPRSKAPKQASGEPSDVDQPGPPPIEVRISAKTRFPIGLKIGDNDYGIQILPGEPTSLVIPESVRESLVVGSQSLARETSPLPPR